MHTHIQPKIDQGSPIHFMCTKPRIPLTMLFSSLRFSFVPFISLILLVCCQLLLHFFFLIRRYLCFGCFKQFFLKRAYTSVILQFCVCVCVGVFFSKPKKSMQFLCICGCDKRKSSSRQFLPIWSSPNNNNKNSDTKLLCNNCFTIQLMTNKILNKLIVIKCTIEVLVEQLQLLKMNECAGYL